MSNRIKIDQAEPAGYKALLALEGYLASTALTTKHKDPIKIRASQINGCAFCINMHTHDARKAGESEERLAAVAAWRDTPYFTDAERAALALSESVTRLSDRADPVPDAIWNEAAKHYDEKGLASLLLIISLTNIFNRFNVATRQVAGPAW